MSSARFVPYASVFNDDDSDFLSKTFAGGGDQKTGCLSIWVKRGFVGASRFLFSATDGAAWCAIYFNSTPDRIAFYNGLGGSALNIVTTQLVRDPTNWMHLFFFWDTTPAVPGSSDCGIVINGTQVTALATETYPAQNDLLCFNGALSHSLGRKDLDNTQHFDGYLAEIIAID